MINTKCVGLKKCGKFLKIFPIKYCSTCLDWGRRGKGINLKSQNSNYAKKTLRIESTEKHSNDNKNTRVLNVRPRKDYCLSTNHEEIPSMKTTGMNYGPCDL